MRTSTWNIVVVGTVITVIALMAVWMAMLAGFIVDLPMDSEWTEAEQEGIPRDLPKVPNTLVQVSGGEQVLVPEPIETMDPEDQDPVTGDPPIEIDELRRLADLEGKQDFTNSYYSPYDYYMTRSYYDDWALDSADLMEANAGSVPAEIRDIEEADLVKVVGNLVYILNPYRGLLIYDVSDPDNPVGLGSASILGDPVEMYVVDDRAYVIVSTSYGYWYRFWSWSPFIDIDFNPRYQIGTQLVILDISDRSQPSIIKEVGIEGFVTDSRRVGKVIYVVSTCRSWYNIYSNTNMDDSTYVLSLNIRDPQAIKIIDEVSFPGDSNEIHVTVDHLYVAQWSYDWGRRSRYGQTNITIVDISDPDGAIIVMDTFPVEGYVNDRYQMDEWDGTFRVVSHFFIGIGQSELFTYDVSDPWSVEPLGHLVIDDNGQLMATRFEGDRGYTIHLPRSIDPLDVLDLSDPSNPLLCDVFEMPGWVTHMEVRGYKIIAIGVDDSTGENNVAVSLFDVSDPWNVVMEERVRLGGEYARSNANWDPKALTVLDDQGLVLVPFMSYGVDLSDNWYSYYAVQVVSFDLKAGDLELGGYFEQPDQVTRTRSVNGRVMATSNSFLQIADVRNIHKPEVIRTVDLCPDVEDHRIIDGHTVELIREHGTDDLRLRTFAKGRDDISVPIVDRFVSTRNVKWFWEGRMLYAVSTKDMGDDYWQVIVAKVDLEDPTAPTVSEFRFYITEPEGDYSYFEYPGTSWMYTSSYNWDWGYGFDQMDCPSNPVMVSGSRIAYYVFGTLYIIDVSGTSISVISSLTIETDMFLGLLVREDRVLLIEYETTDVSTNDEWYYSRYYWETYSFTVRAIDIQYDGSLRDGGSYSVPGILVGASTDGRQVYTISQWWEGEEDLSNKTLNIVSLEDDEATTVAVYDLTGKGAIVMGDRAMIFERASRVCGVNENGTEMNESITVIRTLDLTDLKEVRRDYLVGDYTPKGNGEDFIILRGSDQSGLTIMDLRSEKDDTTFGYYKARDHLVSAYRQGDVIFLVQGIYGVTGLQLPS